jgi:hypothetical protein
MMTTYAELGVAIVLEVVGTTFLQKVRTADQAGADRDDGSALPVGVLFPFHHT